MRMIGIGLLGFLLAGVALLLSTMDILEKGQRLVREMADGPQLVFEDRTAVPSTGDYTAIVYRSTPAHPIILSGLPAYQGVAFNMPLDARPTSGYLQVDATFQVLQGVEGVLRISIDNTRRGEVLLRSGEVGRSLQIPLSSRDFARDQLVVSFSLQGEGPNSQCRINKGFDAVVEIETTSAIFLTLDRPLGSARDRVNAWGAMVRVAWPQWLKPQERIRRLVLATEFKRRDIDTVFIDDHSADALTTLELHAALPFFSKDTIGAISVPRSAWPRPVALKGANSGLRRFYQSTTWRVQYDLRNGDTHSMPVLFYVQLAMGRTINSDPWSLTITLNNRLVHQNTIEAGLTEYAAHVPLPLDMQSATNTVEINLAAHRQTLGPCDHGPELFAEMQPETVLIQGQAQFSDAITEQRQALSAIGQLTVGTLSILSAADADAASSLLAEILPADVQLKPATNTAQIVLLTANDPRFTLPETQPIWLITRDPLTRALVARAIASGSVLPPTGIAVLILPDGLNLSTVTT